MESAYLTAADCSCRWHRACLGDLVEELAKYFALSDEKRKELLPSGSQARFDNRVGWARTALKKAGLLSSPRWSYVQITDSGRNVLKAPPPQLDEKYLIQYPGFAAYKSGSSSSNQPIPAVGIANAALSPQELLADTYKHVRIETEEELLNRIKQLSPDAFEKLVIKVLVAMGYGGTFSDAAQAVGQSGDGGIDGVVKEDRLGLDAIYVQAKRYTVNNVPAKDVGDFVGALVAKKARKGVFITTADFQNEAKTFALAIEGKSLVLVDGKQLASLMVEHSVGVSVLAEYKVYRIDEDFFLAE